MPSFDYHDLHDTQFESIVVSIGQKLFGMGLQGFTSGSDGGRDAKFVGTAELFPSSTKPWTGCTIIQAKHTSGINASYSDKTFANVDKQTGSFIKEEIPRIQKLVSNGEANNYLLVSNRSLTGNTQKKITDYISCKCDLDLSNISVRGVDCIDKWLEQFPDVKGHTKFNPLDRPMIVDPSDLSKVVEEFAHIFSSDDLGADSVPTPRTSYAEKNQLNNMSSTFASDLQRRFMSYTQSIAKFLADPINSGIKSYYIDASDEFSLKVSEIQNDDDTFDSVYNYLIDHLISRSTLLKQNKRLTRAMLFYMYWNCDVGKNKDD